jgi:Ca2+-binding EF-hand superfamily protein
LNEFAKVLKKLDESFLDEEIEQVFAVVDQDNSNSIQFAELNSYYSKINGIPESLNMTPEANFFKKP